MGDVRLHGINLVTGNMEAALAFYRELGVEIPESNVWSTESGMHHVTAADPTEVDVEFDSVELAGSYNDSSKVQDPTGSTLVGFSVGTREEVDAIYERLVGLGHRSLHPPTDAFWGARHAIIEDPDGRPIGIMSPSDPERQSPPPDI
ncbi:MAG: VOC family protein [Acidimicrobiales bacterium]